MTHDPTLFSDNQEYQVSANVKLSNGVGMTISHIGSASCVSPVSVLSLQNTLHVPTLNKNLLSVSKFVNDNIVLFEFYSNSLHMVSNFRVYNIECLLDLSRFVNTINLEVIK